MAAAAGAKSSAVRVGEEEFVNKLKAAANDEIKVKGLKGAEADAVRAHYDGIAKNGEAYVDLGTGNTYVSSAVANVKVGEVLRHEVAHRSFHELPLGKRQKLVAEFEGDPNRAAITKQVMAENPHGSGARRSVAAA